MFIFGPGLIGGIENAPLPGDLPPTFVPARKQAEGNSIGVKLRLTQVTPGLIAFAATVVCLVSLFHLGRWFLMASVAKVSVLLNLEKKLTLESGTPSGTNYYEIFRAFHRFLAVGLDIEASKPPDSAWPLHDTISWYNQLLFGEESRDVRSGDRVTGIQGGEVGDSLEALLKSMETVSMEVPAQVSPTC